MSVLLELPLQEGNSIHHKSKVVIVIKKLLKLCHRKRIGLKIEQKPLKRKKIIQFMTEVI